MELYWLIVALVVFMALVKGGLSGAFSMFLVMTWPLLLVGLFAVLPKWLEEAVSYLLGAGLIGVGIVAALVTLGSCLIVVIGILTGLWRLVSWAVLQVL